MKKKKKNEKKKKKIESGVQVISRTSARSEGIVVSAEQSGVLVLSPRKSPTLNPDI